MIAENNTTTTTPPQKKSVVDDFFSALFSNRNSNDAIDPKQPIDSHTVMTTPAPPTPIKQEENIRELDEFDEYSLLSKSRHSEQPDDNLERQILSKKDIDWSNVKPESRMLVRQLPKSISKQEVLAHFKKYGEVLEVVQKTHFGFVHFANPTSCAKAVQAENGQTFHGVVLDLEICKRKPYFARAAEKEKRMNTHKHEQDINKRTSLPPPPPPPLRNNGKAPLQPSLKKRRHEPYNDYRPDYGRKRQENDVHDYGRKRYAADDTTNYRPNGGYREGPINNNTNRYQQGYTNFKQEYNSHRNNNTPQRYNEQSNGYRNDGYDPDNVKYEESKQPVIPFRHGADLPMVQIVSWGNVAYAYTDYMERTFTSHGIRAASITLPFSHHTRDAITKQMVLEGVKAMVLIDRPNETLNKLYLQVFSPTEYGQNVQFDEYDSITIMEAISIIQHKHGIPARTAPTPPVQQQQSYHQQNNHSPSPIYATAPAPAINANTLASLYSMLQQQPPSRPSTSTATTVQQPTIPQLLATLVNGFQPVAPTPVPQYSPAPQQQDIAALISTAAHGNPALAQLLAQISSNANN